MKKVNFTALFVTPYSHTVINGYGIAISQKSAKILIKEALKKFEGKAKFFWENVESTYDEESNVIITYSSQMVVANPEGGGTVIKENTEIGPIKKS